MIIPTKYHLLVKISKPKDKEGKFMVADTNRFFRPNKGKVIRGDEYEGKTVYFHEFSGVDVAKDLIILHKDDIVAYEKGAKNGI